MKKYFIVLILITTVTSYSVSQSPTFGVQAGITLANEKAKFADESEKSDSKIGFTAGILADFPLQDNLSFQPSLNFTQKGASTKDDSFGTEKITLNYLEVPLNLVFKIGERGQAYFGLGPVLSVGLSGKDKFEFEGSTEEEDITFGSNEDEDLKRFEFSGNILAGYMITGGLSITANYNMGISSIVHGDNDLNASIRNNYFGIRLGYLLSGNKE